MEPWIGTREAAEHLGVTLRTLYQLIDEGRLPAYKMGRVIRLKAEDVDRFGDDGSGGGTTVSAVPGPPKPSFPGSIEPSDR